MSTEWPEVDPDAIPGSRPRVEHEKREPEPTEALPWDSHPKNFRVNGHDLVLFDTSALIRALGLRDPNQVRYWERKGWFPKTDIRVPRQVKPLHSKTKGTTTAMVGRRLYPKAFIEGCIRIAAETGLDKPGAVPEGTDFPGRVFDLWEECYPR